MERDGHIIGPYVEFRNEKDISAGIENSLSNPRFSNGYTAIQNRPGLLVETHSLKSFRTRIWSHYDMMKHSLEIIYRKPAQLKKANQIADAGVARLGASYRNKHRLHINGELSDESAPFIYKAVESCLAESELTGDDYLIYDSQPIDIATPFYHSFITTAAPIVPLAYIIPRQWFAVIDLLKLHGVKTEVLKKDVTAQFEVYYFDNPCWRERPFEGRHMLSFDMTTARETHTLPAGSTLVPMNQRAARVALNILEPEASDSAVRWGFFDAIFEQKEEYSEYVMTPIAHEMMESFPDLRDEFLERLSEDEEFADNPKARLDFFYHRSPYYEPDLNLYPIVRVIKKLA
jgi:hypothetical protein